MADPGRTRTQTLDSNPGFVKLHALFKVPRVPFPGPAVLLAEVRLGRLVEMAGGWGQGCSHKALQGSKAQEMAPSDCPTGLGAGS